MKLALAQTRPSPGDIPKNIDRHIQWIELAADQNATMIIFPELSLTGYEPAMAARLATTAMDARLDVFQNLSDRRQIIIGVGLPIAGNMGTYIGMGLFQPQAARRVYGKYFLHPDEETHFVHGKGIGKITVEDTGVALAICYELSVPAHAQAAHAAGAEIYLASVAKSAAGVAQARERLAVIARRYTMITAMANSAGPCSDFICAGQTSVWDNRGELLSQMDDNHEGILLCDTQTLEARTVLCP